MSQAHHLYASALASALALASLAPAASAQPHADARAAANASARVARQTTAAQTFAALPRAALRGHARDIVSLDFSPDGRLLATADEGGGVRVWDARTGEAVSNFRAGDGAAVLELLWSPDGGRILINRAGGGGEDGGPQVWDARAARPLATFAGHKLRVNTADWSADGRAVVTASDDGIVKVWDAETGRPRLEIVYEKIDTTKYTDSILKDLFTKKKLPDHFHIAARFASGGRTLLADSNGHPPRLYSAADGRELSTLLTAAQILAPRYVSRPYYERARLGPGGRVAATQSPAGVELWDAGTGAWLRRLADAAGEPEFSPDGRAILAGWRKSPFRFFDSESAVLKLWDVETGEPLRAYENLPGAVETFWSPDGGKVVRMGTGQSRPRLLDLDAGRVVAKLPYGGCTSDSPFAGDDCAPFVFSADGRLTAKLRGALKLFDTRDGRLVATLEGTHRRATFHPTDARLLAARSKDKRSILLFELAAK
ncbi:MAG: hypothetical protein LC800_04615 [Acidobacteria bacterium]|nr:hypothetical protein [Acidobacteriota bacterium]